MKPRVAKLPIAISNRHALRLERIPSFHAVSGIDDVWLESLARRNPNRTHHVRQRTQHNQASMKEVFVADCTPALFSVGHHYFVMERV